MTRVGWIGLGAMGAPMAARVARAGHAVVAYDIDPGRARSLAADGVKAATTVSQAARGAEVLAVMVATPAQVEVVLYGDDPAAAALPPDSVVLVMATVGPAAVHDWATRLAKQGLHLVDAPVSGGVARAAAGDLLIMVGAPEATVLKVRPLLDAMARFAPVVGSVPGDGQKVKLVNQLLCGVHIAVAAEALAFAEAMGLDAETTWEVVRHGAAASFMLHDRGERMVHGSFEQVKSALDIFVKDMGLVVDAARQHAYPAPLASSAEQLYLAGRRAGLGRLDDSSVIEILRGGPAVSSATPPTTLGETTPPTLGETLTR
jgi:3-hydroxyisobutyrate dehydrogenase